LGPDISEVGSTWVRSLAAGNELVAFSPFQVDEQAGMNAFICPHWEEHQQQVFSIPFLVETRLVCYRKDMLAAAGIAEETAFSSPQAFYETIKALARHGVEKPLLIPVEDRWLNLSLAACWVWGAGGDFISPDGKKVVFDQENTLSGLADYFSLAQYLSADLFEIKNPTQAFFKEQYAVTLGGPWVYSYFLEQYSDSPAFRDNIGVAPTPGHTYQGGTNLTIWRHSRSQNQALSLIQFLTSFEFQSQWDSSILPARRDVLALPAYSENPFLNIMVQSILSGRSYSDSPLWGVVEDRLSRALQQAWRECLGNPARPVLDILRDILFPLAHRINITLQN
jgi:multiple sugar transport system substrate-binding protein